MSYLVSRITFGFTSYIDIVSGNWIVLHAKSVLGVENIKYRKILNIHDETNY